MNDGVKGKCVGLCVCVTEGQLYSTGLLGAGGPGFPSWEACTAAEISPG